MEAIAVTDLFDLEIDPHEPASTQRLKNRSRGGGYFAYIPSDLSINVFRMVVFSVSETSPSSRSRFSIRLSNSAYTNLSMSPEFSRELMVRFGTFFKALTMSLSSLLDMKTLTTYGDARIHLTAAIKDDLVDLSHSSSASMTIVARPYDGSKAKMRSRAR